MSKWRSVRIPDGLYAAVLKLMKLQGKTFTWYVVHGLAQMLDFPLEENEGGEE